MIGNQNDNHSSYYSQYFTMNELKFTPTSSLETHTVLEQRKIEKDCADMLLGGSHLSDTDTRLKLLRNEHFAFLAHGLLRLGPGFQALDASKPWIVYWIVHSLDLLGLLSPQLAPGIVATLKQCQHPNGGFSGGPGQIPHLATTYAAVHALIITGGVWPKAYEAIDRNNLYRFLLSMKRPDGSFSMHKDGEVDIRGVYCCLSAAWLTNLITPELTAGTANWIKLCQTHEGGIAGNPENEAHGGYAFCGLAAAGILDRTDVLDVSRLARWSAMRQMRLEGGFQGRVNKLVDACYSFWVGGLFPILAELKMGDKNMIFNRKKLQEYLLLCCQSEKGGLIDKPGKNRDFYHTCYALSGIAIAQHGADTETRGPSSNLLRCRLHTLHNMCVDRVESGRQYFINKRR